MKKERQSSEWVSIQELYGKKKKKRGGDCRNFICDPEGKFLKRVDQVTGHWRKHRRLELLNIDE